MAEVGMCLICERNSDKRAATSVRRSRPTRWLFRWLFQSAPRQTRGCPASADDDFRDDWAARPPVPFVTCAKQILQIAHFGVVAAAADKVTAASRATNNNLSGKREINDRQIGTTTTTTGSDTTTTTATTATTRRASW